MKKLISTLIFLFATQSYAQFTNQGISPLNESIDVSVAATFTKTLTLKNTSGQVQSISSLSGADAASFKIATNRCINIAPTKSCSISISSQRGIVQRPTPYTVSVADFTLNLSVTKAGDNIEPVKVSALSINSEVNLNTIEINYLDKSKTIIVEVKNTGDNNELPVFSLGSGDLSVLVVLNRCSGVTLAPTKSCSVSLKISDPISYANKTRVISVSSNSQELASKTIFAKRQPLRSSPVSLTGIQESETRNYDVSSLISGGKAPYNITGYALSGDVAVTNNGLVISSHWTGSDLALNEIRNRSATMYLQDSDGNSINVSLSFEIIGQGPALSASPISLTGLNKIQENSTRTYNVAPLISGGTPPYSISFSSISNVSVVVNSLSIDVHYTGSDLALNQTYNASGTMTVQDSVGVITTASVSLEFIGQNPVPTSNLAVINNLTGNTNLITSRILDSVEQEVQPKFTTSNNYNSLLATNRDYNLQIRAELDSQSPAKHLNQVSVEIYYNGIYSSSVNCTPVILTNQGASAMPGGPTYNCPLIYNEVSNTAENYKSYQVKVYSFVADGSIVLGCTDNTANNYNAGANFKVGCTYGSLEYTKSYPAQNFTFKMKTTGGNAPAFNGSTQIINLVNMSITCGGVTETVTSTNQLSYFESISFNSINLVGNDLKSGFDNSFSFSVYFMNGSYIDYYYGVIYYGCGAIGDLEQSVSPNYIMMSK